MKRKYVEVTQELLDKVRSGDEEAGRVIYEDYYRIIYLVARKYAKDAQGIENLYELGLVGMAKAINTFDPTHNTKFTTYLTTVVTNEILMDYRRLKNQVATISFDACLTDDGNGGQLLFEDVLGAEDLYFKDDGGRLAEIVKRIIRTKFSNHAEIIYERIKGKQQKQIGKELEISQSYISRIYKRFCRDLSQELVATGYLKKGELKDFRKARTSNMPEPEQMPKIIYLTPKPELKPASKRGRPAFKPVKEFTRDAAEKLLKNGVSQYRIVKMYGFVDTGQVHYRLKKWGLLPEKKVPEQSGNLLERLRSDNVQLDKFNSVLIRCRDEIKEHERYADMEILYKLITGALAEYDKLESIAK